MTEKEQSLAREVEHQRARADNWRSQAYNYALKCELLEEQLSKMREDQARCGTTE